MVNRLEQAVELVDAVGLPSVRVVADTYHMNIEEDEPTPRAGRGRRAVPRPRAGQRLQPLPARRRPPRLGRAARHAGRDRLRRLPGRRVPAARRPAAAVAAIPASCAGTAHDRRPAYPPCATGPDVRSPRRGIVGRSTGRPAGCWSPTGGCARPCPPPGSTRTSGAGTRRSSRSGCATCPPPAPSASWSRCSARSGRDGRMPHIVFDPRCRPTRTSPARRSGAPRDVPGAPAVPTSGIVQPPVHALAAWVTYRADPAASRARGFLRRLYPRLVAWHGYLDRAPRPRRPRAGRRSCTRGSPGWTTARRGTARWRRVDAAAAGRVRAAATSPTRRRRAAHRRRTTGATCGSPPTTATPGTPTRWRCTAFAVEDPLCNALLVAGEHALAAIADGDRRTTRARTASARAGSTEALVDGLYDPAAGMFFPRDVHTGDAARGPTRSAGSCRWSCPTCRSPPSWSKTALGDRFRLRDACPLPSLRPHRRRPRAGPLLARPRLDQHSWLFWHGLRLHGEHGARRRPAAPAAGAGARRAGSASTSTR